MTRRNLLLPAVVLLLLLLAPPSRAQEALPFSIEFKDTVAMIAPYSTKDLKAIVTNLTDQAITVRLVRLENNLPDVHWFSALCWGDLCYDTATSAPDPARLGPNEAAEFKLTVGVVDSFPDPSEMARVRVRFDTGLFTEGIEQEFRVGIAVAGIDPEQPRRGRPAWPNPATDRLSVELPSDAASAVASLSLVDNLGRVIELGSTRTGAGAISAALNDVPAGAYIYRLVAGEQVWFGPVIVH